MTIIIALATICAMLQDAYRYDASFRSTVSYKVGNLPYLGMFNEHGEFIPDLRTLPREDDWDVTGNGPMPLESRFRDKELLYELRHGVLVPVIYYTNRRFVPEVGGKIILFAQYKYTPFARRIYNLPGRFIPKEQPDLHPK